MNTHADKATENKSSADSLSKEQNNTAQLQLEDNSPEGITQRKLQKLANNSPQSRQLKAFGDLANAKQSNGPVQRKENNTGLPDQLKSGVEQLSGISMNDVKVHYNSGKPAQLNAHAYAQGTNIHVGSGQEKNLPHEAWHVVQQKQGRVQPTTSVNGAAINDNRGLEKEADSMGAKALSASPTQRKTLKDNADITSTAAQLVINPNWWGRWSESAALTDLFDEVEELRDRMDVIWNDIRNVVAVPVRNRFDGEIGNLRGRFNVEDGANVSWEDRGDHMDELTALQTEIGDLIRTELNPRQAKERGGTTRGNIDAIRARSLVAFDRYAEMLNSNAGRFGTYIALFGGVDNFTDVLVAANAATADPDFVDDFLTACQANGWNLLARVQLYFQHLTNAGTQYHEPSLGWLQDFVLAGNVGAGPANALPDHPGDGGGYVALGAHTYNFPISYWWGAPNRAATVIIDQGNLDHWNCGHSFEGFRLTLGNAGRAPVSSMWPRGTTDATKLTHAGNAIETKRSLIHKGIKANQGRITTTNSQGGFDYSIGVNDFAAAFTQYRLDQFFPVGGQGIRVPREVMRAIVRLLGA